MKFPLPVVTALVISTAALEAQDRTASPTQEKPLLAAPIRISLLAVGDPPQPRFDVSREQRTLQETPASDYPPPKVFLRDRSGKEKAFKEVSLGLNTVTGYVVYKGESTLNLYRGQTEDAKDLYASLPIPELHADMTIMLTRSSSKKSWENDPKARFFDNSLTTFPLDSARYVNLSTVPIRVVNGKDPVFEIAPGASRIVRLPRSEQGVLAYRIAAAVDDKIFPISNTATTYTPDTRINLVAYNADGENKTPPVKVIRFFERPPQAVEEKKE